MENSNYLGAVGQFPNAAANITVNSTTGVLLLATMASSIVFSGKLTLDLLEPSTNTWAISFVLGRSDSGAAVAGAYSKSLVGPLDRIRITTVSGTDVFDQGKTNVSWEF